MDVNEDLRYRLMEIDELIKGGAKKRKTKGLRECAEFKEYKNKSGVPIKRCFKFKNITKKPTKKKTKKQTKKKTKKPTKKKTKELASGAKKKNKLPKKFLGNNLTKKLMSEKMKYLRSLRKKKK